VTVAESGAIIEYLLDHYGGGRLIPPVGTPERLRYTYWLHYAEGSAMPPLLLKLVFDRVANGPAPWPISSVARRIAATVQSAFIGPQLKRHLDYMESQLALHSWFAGEEFTAADVQMSFPVEAAASRAGLDASRPRLMAFLERIHARPAYKRALERGGPYAF
jgi:glutathione S-transferase